MPELHYIGISAAFDPYAEAQEPERYTESGYRCIMDGHFVPDSLALNEAAEASGIVLTKDTTQDFMDMLVDWYYSGQFIRVEAGDDIPCAV
jgi:hypothetical protein